MFFLHSLSFCFLHQIWYVHLGFLKSNTSSLYLANPKWFQKMSFIQFGMETANQKPYYMIIVQIQHQHQQHAKCRIPCLNTGQLPLKINLSTNVRKTGSLWRLKTPFSNPGVHSLQNESLVWKATRKHVDCRSPHFFTTLEANLPNLTKSVWFCFTYTPSVSQIRKLNHKEIHLRSIDQLHQWSSWCSWVAVIKSAKDPKTDLKDPSCKMGKSWSTINPNLRCWPKVMTIFRCHWGMFQWWDFLIHAMIYEHYWISFGIYGLITWVPYKKHTCY